MKKGHLVNTGKQSQSKPIQSQLKPIKRQNKANTNPLKPNPPLGQVQRARNPSPVPGN
jgi:hypothetical protein